ncbi:MAG: hypothetical protein R3C16_02075 [Hyphomonadaceae bacterium]
MDNSEVLGPLIFFGFLAAIILVPVIVKERTKRSAHDLISQAMARGQQQPRARLEAEPERDFRG